MEKISKSAKNLHEEIQKLHKRIDELEKIEAKHKKTERELTITNQKLSMIIEHLPGMGYACLNDEHWTMEFVSSGCVELTGYHPVDLIANQNISFNDIIHKDDRDYVREHINQALAKREPWQLLYRIKTAQGDEKWVWEKGMGVFSRDGKLIWLQGFITNQSG